MANSALKINLGESVPQNVQPDIAPLKKVSSSWIKSPLWDSFWILSGLWLLGVISLTPLVGWSEQTSKAPYYVILLLWGGHIFSPIITAWTSKGLREMMLKNKTKFIAGPLAIIGLCALIGILGDLSQFGAPSWTSYLNPRFAMFSVFLFWNTYHFSAQNFGVLSIYHSRAGQIEPADRQTNLRKETAGFFRV